jgi:hypothetical protein
MIGTHPSLYYFFGLGLETSIPLDKLKPVVAVSQIAGQNLPPIL